MKANELDKETERFIDKIWKEIDFAVNQVMIESAVNRPICLDKDKYMASRKMYESKGTRIILSELVEK